MTGNEKKVPYASVGISLLIVSVVLLVIGEVTAAPFFVEKGNSESYLGKAETGGYSASGGSFTRHVAESTERKHGHGRFVPPVV